VIRWAEYIKKHSPEVWRPQQNAVVNGQIESAKTVDVSAEDKKRIRAFGDAKLRRAGKANAEEADDRRTE